MVTPGTGLRTRNGGGGGSGVHQEYDGGNGGSGGVVVRLCKININWSAKATGGAISFYSRQFMLFTSTGDIQQISFKNMPDADSVVGGGGGRWWIRESGGGGGAGGGLRNNGSEHILSVLDPIIVVVDLKLHFWCQLLETINHRTLLSLAGNDVDWWWFVDYKVELI